MLRGNTCQFSIVGKIQEEDRRSWKIRLSQTQACIYSCWIKLFVLFHLCAYIYVCVGWEEVGGGTQCHLKRSAWRHSIRNITPWCQAHFYKHSLNDTQLAAWRQQSLPSLRPNLSFPLFSSSLTLWCSAGLPPFLPPSLPSGSRLCGAEAAKTHFLELAFTSFSFCGTSCAASVIRPVRADSLGETSWCTDSWGDNSPFSAFVRIFFFYLTFCVSRGLLFPLYCFSIYSAELQVYFDTERSESDPPEKDHLLKRQTSKGQHHREMSLTDIRQPNDIRQSHEMQLIPANPEKISCNTAPGCPIKKAWCSPQPAPRPPLWRKRRNVVGVGVWALVASSDWL